MFVSGVDVPGTFERTDLRDEGEYIFYVGTSLSDESGLWGVHDQISHGG